MSKPTLTHSFGNGTGYGNITLLEDPTLCTLQTCDLTLSSFLYLPSLPANITFAGLFGLLLGLQLLLGIKYKTWGYTVAMILGLVCITILPVLIYTADRRLQALEIAGYVARILLNGSPFENDFFLLYLITLTIAPAFLSAAIYLCLSRIVIVYGEHIAFFKPRTYTIVFCTCDCVSLILQAAGGGIASSADTLDDKDVGKNIMLAGLGFQVVSLIVFLACGTDLAIRVWRAKANRNPDYLKLTDSRLFNSFLVSLFIATVTIFARCVYRCVELSGGFNGELFISDEPLFIVMEGAMISIACSCLTVLHAGLCFKGAWQKASFSFRKSEYSSVEELEALSQSGEVKNRSAR
jgi:hypothetical protein